MTMASGGYSSSPASGIGGVAASALRSLTSDNRGIHKRSDVSRSTTIILSTVLSVGGCFLIAGAFLVYYHCRRRRTQLFSRAISPIDDDEIATWKGNRREKELENGVDNAIVLSHQGHRKHESVASTRKSTSVIVYSNSRGSEDRSPRLQNHYGKGSLDGRVSFDKDIPNTPILARAPNAREGLTDDAVPCDDPFVQSPKRQMSRLSKMPPPTVQHPRQAHTRTKSARSSFSFRTIGDHLKNYDSDVDFTPRTSQDYHDGPSRHNMPSRAFTSPSIPPRISISDDWAGPSGLSPTPPSIRREDIGRAFG